MNALLHALRGALGHAQQLDAEAEFLGHHQIQRGDTGNALDIHRIAIHLGAKGQRGQQRELVGRIIALDIEVGSASA